MTYCAMASHDYVYQGYKDSEEVELTATVKTVELLHCFDNEHNIEHNK